ncbi:hypothetical protein ASC61_02400 [Aeromicrobium sp. Root344]|uniref:hypothetical protein n=1 Tax=Aeromicrobium sp. Root344 TaxID=1736521 RepID=UPI0006F5A24D|nr:hypothetical protein [Aeromicrobium sp. Root344]KQV73946.1 hypothetical protein ASC61_02400 [Aeromicrobium sp. Root344]
MAVDMLVLKPSAGLHELVVQRLAEGPLGGVDRLVIEAAADEVVGLIRTLAPRQDDSLVEAVRRFHDDDWMAACAFADDQANAPGRAATARRVVRERVDLAFGSSAADVLMHAAIVRGYLDVHGGHLAAQRELHLSRATFYRTLRRARGRLSDTD